MNNETCKKCGHGMIKIPSELNNSMWNDVYECLTCGYQHYYDLRIPQKIKI